MHPGKLCRVGLAAHAGADALYLVGRQGNPDAGSADGDTEIRLAGGHGTSNLLAVNRVVTALLGVRPEIHDFISL